MDKAKGAYILLTMFFISSAQADLTVNFPALRAIFNFFGTDFINGNRTKDVSQMTLDELGISRGQCVYNFLDYISYNERSVCVPEDFYILHLLPNYSTESPRKPPIMVKCLELEPNPENKLELMKSVKDIMELLKPVGNATKRHEPGSCVFILFHSWTSLTCAHVSPHANMLPGLFRTLRFAAIDAFEFPSFNTEFGIVGLPTLLLFHQGRPIIKFYSEAGTFQDFITRHTGIKSADINIDILPWAAGPLSTEPREERDYVLVLAWAFILLCIGNYFAKSRWCKQIIEMIKRNWRESEAQMEHN